MCAFGHMHIFLHKNVYLFEPPYTSKAYEKLNFPGKGHGNSLQYSCWKIPWTEEPGGLHSMGSQRIGHDWSHNTKIKHCAFKAVQCSVMIWPQQLSDVSQMFPYHMEEVRVLLCSHQWSYFHTWALESLLTQHTLQFSNLQNQHNILFQSVHFLYQWTFQLRSISLIIVSNLYCISEG